VTPEKLDALRERLRRTPAYQRYQELVLLKKLREADKP
jgi:hypothetical protein